MIVLPTKAEHVRVFEKTLIGGFSCVNTRLAFDTQILLSNKENEKAIFDLEINKQRQIKRVSTKILKMDENNQYGQAITKPPLYGCMKKQKHVPSLLEFNKMLDRISHEDSIVHLFVVNIKCQNNNKKTLLFNAIYILMYLYFPYYLPDKEQLANDTFTDKNIYHFPWLYSSFFCSKILSSYCSRYTYEYIPHRDLWLNRMYFYISSSNKKQCLTIDK